MKAQHRAFTAVLAFTLCTLVPATAAAQALPAAALVEKAAQYDGQTVTYRGEVIGDIMRRGPWAVVNVHDGTYGIGVWVPARVATEITWQGRYGTIGDTVEVRGTLHRACVEHGGDLDLHAEQITVVRKGHPVPQPSHPARWAAASVLGATAAGLAIWERCRRRANRPAGQPADLLGRKKGWCQR